MAAAQGKPGPAEALGWRSFQACVAISKGTPLAKAATEAGYRLEGDAWVADVDGRRFVLLTQPFQSLPNGRACLVVVRGPLADHDGFAKRLGDWAVKDGFSDMGASTTPSGGKTVQYGDGTNLRLLLVALFPDGNPEQPTRSSLFLGWKGE